MRDSSIEFNGLRTSYTGRGNLQPKCTKAAKDVRAVKGLAQSQTLAERRPASPPELAGSHHRHACFQMPLSHRAAGTGRVEAIQHKLSRTVPTGTPRDPVPAATVVLCIDATLRRFLWLAGLLLAMLPVPQGRAQAEQPCLPCPPRLGWQLSTAVLHRAAAQSSSRDASSSNNVEESVTLENTPHLLADQSVLGPDMLKYLCCK